MNVVAARPTRLSGVTCTSSGPGAYIFISDGVVAAESRSNYTCITHKIRSATCDSDLRSVAGRSGREDDVVPHLFPGYRPRHLWKRPRSTASLKWAEHGKPSIRMYIPNDDTFRCPGDIGMLVWVISQPKHPFILRHFAVLTGPAPFAGMADRSIRTGRRRQQSRNAHRRAGSTTTR